VGSFIDNLHVYRQPVDAVVAALGALITSDAYVGASGDPWVNVYPAEKDGASNVAERLSKRLHAAVLVTMVHDSDVLFYQLLEDGESVDEFASNPDYFAEEPLDDDERARLAGDPTRLLPYAAPGATAETLRAILDTPELFAEKSLEALAAALGIDARHALATMRYLDGGDCDVDPSTLKRVAPAQPPKPANRPAPTPPAAAKPAGAAATELYDRGKALEKETRYGEAYDLYEQALVLVPSESPTQRMTYLIKLASTAVMASRPAQAIAWAEEAIGSGADGTYSVLAHNLAGVAYKNLKDFERAVYHAQTAYEQALASGKPDQAADNAATLASIQYGRGNLEQAAAMAREVIRLDPARGSSGYIVVAKCYAAHGQYEDALAAYRHAAEAIATRFPGNPVPAATVDYGVAEMLAKLARYDQALEHLGEIEQRMSSETAVAAWCLSLRAQIHAEQGRTEEALALLPQLSARIHALAGNRDTVFRLTMAIARTYFVTGDYAQSLDYWSDALLQTPEPISLPRIHYHQGECHRRLGDVDAARRCWREAVALDIDTVDARDAEQRLGDSGT
jgi:tetratricopeptide (TPR) repeat protein